MERAGSKLGAGHPRHAIHATPDGAACTAHLGKGTALPSPLHPLPAGLLAPLHPDKDGGLPPAGDIPAVSLDVAEAPASTSKRSSGSEARQRQHAVRVRLDDAERELLERRAGDTGLSLSAYMRTSSLGAPGPRARRRIPIERDLLARTNADLNRVGNNLNQIARTLNGGGETPAAEIADVAAELRQTLTELRQAFGYDRQR